MTRKTSNCVLLLGFDGCSMITATILKLCIMESAGAPAYKFCGIWGLGHLNKIYQCHIAY